MTTALWDVLIIGGGPAGATAAFHLARQGVKAAVLDRAIFPRDKTCGDILSGTAIDCLARMGLASLLVGRTARRSWQVYWGALDGRTFEYPVNPQRKNGLPRWATIPRLELDAALLRHAQAAGTVLFERATAESFQVEADQVTVGVKGVAGGRLSARLLLIAQGSLGKFALRPPDYFSLRGYYAGPPDAPLTLRFVSDLSPGYEWQFPVGERYNIGIYTTIKRARQLRLDHQLAESTLLKKKQRLGQLRGAYLNTAFGQSPAHAERVLWLGDAAGLVQPHLGEGIAPALQSGEIAAECAVSSLASGDFTAKALARYTRRLHQTFDGELRWSKLLKGLEERPRALRTVGNFAAANYEFLSRVMKRTSSLAD